MNNKELIKKIDTAINNYRDNNFSFRNFWQQLKKSGDFYIIGGAIRSIFKNRKPRDIDIIVKDNLQKILESLDDGVVISKNYYGGFKIDFSGIIVDIWDFKNHWAFEAGILNADEKNLAESCFFDFDALVYSPTNSYLNIDHFKKSLEANTIDLISNDTKYVSKNPGNLTNVLRAFVAAKDFNLRFSTSVISYIKPFLENNDFSSLKECESRHYKEEKISFEQFNRILQTISDDSYQKSLHY